MAKTVVVVLGLLILALIWRILMSNE